jgi:hypothetical protein
VGDTALKARHALLGWLVCASVALGGGIAVASAILGDVISGTITAINVNMVSIQGRAYPIATGSAAYAAAQTLKPGQVVDVQLNGPAKSSESQVINITLHSGD